MSTKSDSEGEFVDAVEAIDAFGQPSLSASTQQQSDENAVLPCISPVSIYTKTGIFQNQLNESTVKNANRHGRLAMLRNRMKNEFGAGSGPLLMGEGEDNSQSDCTSMASWGRNLLMEQGEGTAMLTVVSPVDSISTRALPSVLQSDVSYSPNDYTSSLSNGVTRSETNGGQQSVEVDGKGQESIKHVLNGQPTIPPPPLPTSLERPENLALRKKESISPVEFVSPNTSFPPPLPPRQSATSKLPAAMLNIQNSPKRPAKALEVLISSPMSPYDAFGKKRGHVKTNSLDRGLSLAKSMKSGPFPPPSSSKSNSLNRGCSPNAVIVSTVCEEDQRINSAHGIIQQLTFSVLSNPLPDSTENAKKTATELGTSNKLQATFSKCCSHLTNSLAKFPSHAASKELAAVGEESFIPARSPIPLPKMLFTPHYENLSLQTDYTQKVEKEESPTVSSPTIPTKNNNKSAALLAESKKQKLLSDETPNSAALRTLSHIDSIDPVTRDVKRRMSSLNDANFLSIDQKEDDSLSTNSSRSNIRQAQAFMRSYGSSATGFVKGAVANTVQKAKNVVSARSSKKLADKVDDLEENEDESESDGEGTASISDHLTSAKSPAPAALVCRPKNAKKGPFDFDQLKPIQELNNEHTGAVWCIKFSVCGRLICTAGQDNIIRVWVLKNYLNHFTRMRERYSKSTGDKLQSAMQEIENLRIQEEEMKNEENDYSPRSSISTSGDPSLTSNMSTPSSSAYVIVPKPFCIFRGHTADVLDLSWSPRNYFILSSSIDRSVKLWHLTRNECLCCFQHMDIVTCIAFMPKDDRYFISGSLDGKIRLWHIPEKKVALWNEVEQVKFITAIAFVRNGKFVVVGTYNGRCFFYSTDQLKYHTVIVVRSSRGKNSRGHKITSLAVHGDKLLITSNDSRVRIYDLRDMELTCKFKGAQLEHSQIRASFSPDGRHIISGSEDNYAYIWRTGDLPPSISVRKDRNYNWERIRAHNCVVTAAIFAPKPHLFLPLLDDELKLNDFNADVASSSSRSFAHKNSNAELTRLKKKYKFSNAFSATDQTGHNGSNQNTFPATNFTKSLVSSSFSNSMIGQNGQRDKENRTAVIVSADLNGNIKIFANES